MPLKTGQGKHPTNICKGRAYREEAGALQASLNLQMTQKRTYCTVTILNTVLLEGAALSKGNEHNF